MATSKVIYLYVACKIEMDQIFLPVKQYNIIYNETDGVQDIEDN